MRRRLLNLLTGLSLLLCVAVVALWVRSYWRADELEITGTAEWRVFSLDGRITARLVVTREGDPLGSLTVKKMSERPRLRYDSMPSDEFWYRHWEGEWFEYERGEWAGMGVFAERGIDTPVWVERHAYHDLTFPHALLAMIAAVPPVANLLALWRRRRRSLFDHCPSCDYDMRATPDRCPECGRAADLPTVKTRERLAEKE